MPISSLLVSSSTSDCDVKLWNTTNGSLVRSFSWGNFTYLGLGFLDSNTLVVSDDGGNIRAVEMTNGNVLKSTYDPKIMTSILIMSKVKKILISNLILI